MYLYSISTKWITAMFLRMIMCAYAAIKFVDEGDIRLVGGSSSNEGRLEIFHNNQWGTVCHDGFNTDDGIVACRQLGYTGFVKYQCCGQLGGRGTGPIWLEGIACNGSEYNLLDCSNKGWNNTNCGHHEDIGLVCQGIRFNFFITISTRSLLESDILLY